MKVKMLFWKNIDVNNKHENGMIYFYCSFLEDWNFYPYITSQIYSEHRFKRLNLSREK